MLNYFTIAAVDTAASADTTFATMPPYVNDGAKTQHVLHTKSGGGVGIIIPRTKTLCIDFFSSKDKIWQCNNNIIIKYIYK